MAKGKAIKGKRVARGELGGVASTRFTPEQRELIEKASGLANCSPSQFIREASVRAGVEAVNASGAIALRGLALLVARQIVKPEAEIVYELPDGKVDTVRVGFGEERPDADFYSVAEIKLASPVGVGYAERVQIKEALETCGSEFVKLVLDAWASIEAKTVEYKPKVKASDLLKGTEDEK